MSRFYIDDEISNLKTSSLRLFVGDCIGSGASRRVYEVAHDKTLVLKVEHAGRCFHNATEWLIWEVLRDWPIADWFAPCIEIDSYGNAMLQKRTEPFQSEKDFRLALQRTRAGIIPDVFSDIHYGNFGMLNGVVTCHDYGYHGFFEKVARDLSIDAGYIAYDSPVEDDGERRDWTKKGQYALDL